MEAASPVVQKIFTERWNLSLILILNRKKIFIFCLPVIGADYSVPDRALVRTYCVSVNGNRQLPAPSSTVRRKLEAARLHPRVEAGATLASRVSRKWAGYCQRVA